MKLNLLELKLIYNSFVFIKSLYLGYSHYLESLHASGKFKDLDFDKLVGKREKTFGKKETLHNSNTETLCLSQKDQKP